MAAKFFAARLIKSNGVSEHVCMYVGDERADREISKRLGRDIVIC